MGMNNQEGQSSNWLEKEVYQKVLKTIPVVSVDLLVVDSNNRVLLGKRNNRPALGKWFVPGGRLNRYERLDEAVKRLSISELGSEGKVIETLGVFHQIYPDNFIDETSGSHYITFATYITVPDNIVHDDQHDSMEWWKISDLLESNMVHEITKNYFREVSRNRVSNL